MNATVQPTRYIVTLLPLDHYEVSVWSLEIVWTGMGRDSPHQWAVRRGSRCLSRAGELESEPIPSSRTDEWLDAHRYTFDEAVAAAQAFLPTMRINGLTSAEVLALTP